MWWWWSSGGCDSCYKVGNSDTCRIAILKYVLGEVVVSDRCDDGLVVMVVLIGYLWWWWSSCWGVGGDSHCKGRVMVIEVAMVVVVVVVVVVLVAVMGKRNTTAT